MIKYRVLKEWNKIKKKANNPPVNLVSRKYFETITRTKTASMADGQSNSRYRIFWVRQNQDTLNLIDTLWHELLHCMFPYNPEWWIELSAYKLSNRKDGCYGYYATKYKKILSDVPSKRQLLQLIRSISVVMFYGKWTFE